MAILWGDNYTLLFVLIRISVILTFGIFFGDKRVPKTAKFAFMLLLSLIVAPSVSSNIDTFTNYSLVSVILGEILVGFIVGIMSTLIVNVMQIAGSLIDTQGGFGMAQVFDPTTQSQSSLVSQFFITFGLLFFIMNDLHIVFIDLIIKTFDIIPIGTILSSYDLSEICMTVIKTMVASIGMGVCVALPVIGIIFMIDVVLGVATRTMPQLNLFSVGYIIKIATTLVLLYIYSLTINSFIKMISDFIFNAIGRLV